jgi:hypothetical protein
MADLTALWREDATYAEHCAAYQDLVNTGAAWTMDGSTGREAMRLIENGDILLGEVGHRDYYGNYVPSRYEVKPGTKGSAEYVQAHDEDRDD